MQEQELFQSYEVKNWDFSPRIYKILAASAIFNILALLVVGQSNLLTKKGCDSPLVGKVCQVIDTIYVGTQIASTESSSGEVPYDPTVLSPDDEIVMVDVTNQLRYPEGYFALSNPELMQPAGDMPLPPADFTAQNFPGINNPTNPTNPTLGGATNNFPGGGGLINKKPKLPKPNKNAVKGQLPTGFDVDDNATTTNPGPKNVKPNKNAPNQDLTAVNGTNPTTPKPTPSPSPTPDPEDVAKEDSNGIFRNKKPLKDFAKKATVDAKNVKLDAPFSVTIAADLDYGTDGKTVVLKNPKAVKTKDQKPNDDQMAKLAQSAILAIGDSGWLGYLKTIGIKKVVFTLSQDDNFITARIVGDQKDENTAKQSASGLGGFISLGKTVTDGDEKLLLEKATTTAEGKSVILNVVIEKPIAQEIIKRKLKEAEEKTTPKPNGSTAQMSEVNKTSGR